MITMLEDKLFLQNFAKKLEGSFGDVVLITLFVFFGNMCGNMCNVV